MRSALYIFSYLIVFTFWEVISIGPQLQSQAQKQNSQTVPEHLCEAHGKKTLYPQIFTGKTFGPSVFPPFIGSSVIGFKEALAFKESSGNYFQVNSLGYLGKYQFGPGTLKTVGIYNSVRFLMDPQLQEKAFFTNLSRNKWILRREIKAFHGSYINGIEITESGILAAAHLAGPGNVKRYVRSKGAIDVSDSYGTRLSDYMHRFSGFDLSIIDGIQNPRID